jgi:hypothetical protein
MHLLALAMAAAVGTCSPPSNVPCAPETDITVCYNNLSDAKAKAKAEAMDNAKPKATVAGRTTEAAVRAVPTGANGANPTSSSTKKDLLSLFSALAQSASLDSKNQQLTVSLTPSALADTTPFDYQVQAIFHQPQLFSAVKTDLTAAGESSETDTLQGKLNDLDDVEALATLGASSKTLGRRFDENRDEFERLYQAFYMQDLVPTDKGTTFFSLVSKLNQKYTRLRQLGPGDKFPFSILDVDDCAQVNRLIEPAATEQAAAEATLASDVKKYVDVFADLVSNQPQLTGSLSYRFRSQYVGPHELTVDASYVRGWSNLNRYRSSIPAKVPDSLLQDPQALEQQKKEVQAWKDLIDGPHGNDGTLAGVQAQRSLKLSAEYSYIDRYSLTVLPNIPAVTTALGHRLSGSATYGQLVNIGGKQLGNLDALIEYDNYSDDPAKKDRLVASITYTQKINDSFVLPIGIAYANHADFLSDVQDRFSAHFGLRFKFDAPVTTSSASSSSQGQ